MKTLGYLGLGLSGLSASILLSMAGHLWLPKTTVLWVFQLSGVIILWAIALLAAILFGAWCVNAAASAHRKAELDFGLGSAIQALSPALWVIAAIAMINGVALWLI
jgi:hypothetical protein